MSPKDELAPWEVQQARGGTAKVGTAKVKPYVMPDANSMPPIYVPDDAGFVATSGPTVTRPQGAPRVATSTGRNSIVALIAAAGLALAALVTVIVAVPSQPEVVKTGLIVVCVAAVLALGAVVALELPRLSAYTKSNFMPGILVYGSKEQFLKVAGPAGIGTIQALTARGTGRGPLSMVFDRSAKAAGSPEIVALHCDRGHGPEFVGIAWDAVRELKRGDVVWFHMIRPNLFLMYHKLIPFAPRVVTDKATREEVFRALRVGESMFQDHAVAKNMGTRKVFEDGKDLDAGAPRRSQAVTEKVARPQIEARRGTTGPTNFDTPEQTDQTSP